MEATLEQPQRRDFPELMRNSKRVFLMAWRRHPGTVGAIVVLTALQAAFPFIRAGALALLINDLVSAVRAGRAGI